MALCAVFTALIAVGAFIKIPVPGIPFTLQTLFVTLAALLLGPVLGTASVLCYIFLGLVGLPIFTQGGGPMYVLQPSFGYIIGFAIAAFVTGKLAYSTPVPGLARRILASLAGLAIVYFCGVMYYWMISALYLGKSVSARSVIIYCFLVFVPGDAASCVLASVVSKRLAPVLHRMSAA